MNHVKNLYRDFVLIFMIFLFGAGVAQVAQAGISKNAYFYELFESVVMCATMAIPLTLYRMLSGSKFGTDTKVSMNHLSALLICVIVTYASFGFARVTGVELHM